MAGLVVGLVLAVVLFAVNYGRIDLVREIAFGTTYRSNVDRPPGERAILHDPADRVQILRLNGFVFFGTASGLLERIRKRVEAGPIRFLLIDLRRVTGVDSSGVLAFQQGGAARRGEWVRARVRRCAPERVRAQLRRGGVGRRPRGSSGSSRTSIGRWSDARTRLLEEAALRADGRVPGERARRSSAAPDGLPRA